MCFYSFLVLVTSTRISHSSSSIQPLDILRKADSSYVCVLRNPNMNAFTQNIRNSWLLSFLRIPRLTSMFRNTDYSSPLIQSAHVSLQSHTWQEFRGWHELNEVRRCRSTSKIDDIEVFGTFNTLGISFRWKIDIFEHEKINCS